MSRRAHDDRYPISTAGRSMLGATARRCPTNVIGYLQPHEQATPQMLARDCDLVPERRLDEFEIVETGPNKVVFRDKETGVEYRREEAAILVQPQEHDCECFVVDGQNRMHMLRRRGPKAPSKVEPMVTEVSWGRVR